MQANPKPNERPGESPIPLVPRPPLSRLCRGRRDTGRVGRGTDVPPLESLGESPRPPIPRPSLSGYWTGLCRGRRDTGRVIRGTDVPPPGLPEYKPNSPEYEPKSPKYEPPEPTAKTVVLVGVTGQNGASKAGNYT